jgi:hypothetical protein
MHIVASLASNAAIPDRAPHCRCARPGARAQERQLGTARIVQKAVQRLLQGSVAVRMSENARDLTQNQDGPEPADIP